MAKERKHAELRALKGKIREMGTTYEEVAEKLDMESSTLSNKINGYTDFRVHEVQELIAILNIKHDEIIKYFFPSMSRNAS